MTSSPGLTIRIESTSRLDALDLLGRLEGLHTYLVQLGNHSWLVCVSVDDSGETVMPVVRRATKAWATERRLDSTIHAGDRTYEIQGAGTPA